MNPADTFRPTTADRPAPRRAAVRIARRVAGVSASTAVVLVAALAGPAGTAQATTRVHETAAAPRVGASGSSSATGATTPSSSPVTAPASSPVVPSHGNDVPAPGFTRGDGSGTLQAVLVVAIPATPAIVMAFVVFWPRTRSPRSRLVKTDGSTATTSGAGT